MHLDKNLTTKKPVPDLSNTGSLEFAIRYSLFSVRCSLLIHDRVVRVFHLVAVVGGWGVAGWLCAVCWCGL